MPSPTLSPSHEVIIIGGSYAGLSAAMSLGRARRQVLVIDGGLPRNRFTPHAHNMLLHDGESPAALAARARQQVAHYPTVQFLTGQATSAARLPDGTFRIDTAQHDSLSARYLLLATGLRDELPAVPGFAECWGKSVIHCPYCHGYEVADQPTGAWVNGDDAQHLATLLTNWTSDLTIFTNGPATFDDDLRQHLADHHVALNETPITALEHEQGQLRALHLADGRRHPLPVLYARLPLHQASELPAQLGCALAKQAPLLQVDATYRTSVPRVYASGDNCVAVSQLAQAIAAGNMAGAAISRELIFGAH
jgi:thioredoxin reductase